MHRTSVRNVARAFESPGRGLLAGADEGLGVEAAAHVRVGVGERVRVVGGAAGRRGPLEQAEASVADAGLDERECAVPQPVEDDRRVVALVADGEDLPGGDGVHRVRRGAPGVEVGVFADLVEDEAVDGEGAAGAAVDGGEPVLAAVDGAELLLADLQGLALLRVEFGGEVFVLLRRVAGGEPCRFGVRPVGAGGEDHGDLLDELPEQDQHPHEQALAVLAGDDGEHGAEPGPSVGEQLAGVDDEPPFPRVERGPEDVLSEVR
jgi:hypothetical protein